MSVISDQLDALSPRDRKLLSGMVIFFGVVLVVGVFFVMNRTLSAKAETISDKKRALLMIQAYDVRYEVAKARIDQAEENLREYANQPASAFLERAATSVQVREQFSVAKQGTEMDGNLEKTRYRVELTRVPFDLALNYVYDVEAADYPIEVESASWRMQTRRDEVTASLTLELLTFAIEEEAQP